LGKVRVDIVKKTARKLMESYPDKFTMDFEENKQMVAQLLDSSTKWMRNRISGYVTTLKKIEEKRKAAMTAEETQVASET
jgi:small subunit ribosomal protein S17e